LLIIFSNEKSGRPKQSLNSGREKYEIASQKDARNDTMAHIFAFRYNAGNEAKGGI